MIKGIPKTETIWLTRLTEQQETYYITSKENDRNMYYLYRQDGDKAIKIGRAKSPIELEEKYIDGGKSDDA